MLFVEYIDYNDIQEIKEQMCYYKNLKTRSTAEEIFNLLREKYKLLLQIKSLCKIIYVYKYLQTQNSLIIKKEEANHVNSLLNWYVLI